jgi:GAF domain-containing protein
MQQEPQTWRQLLGSLNGEEKRKIIAELGIQGKTLERWIRGYTEFPRPRHLRRLLALLPPQKRVRFLVLAQQDPHFGKYAEDILLPGVKKGILSGFYAYVLEAKVLTPSALHFPTICQLVLIQAVRQLDPNRVGLSLSILKCTPPSPGGKVRTLSHQFSLGNPPWNHATEQKSFFLGAESIPGQAVMAGSPFVLENIHNRDEPGIQSIHLDEYMMSAAALPLQRDGHVAGCLLVMSTQPNFFVPSRFALIEQYGHLLVLAFQDEEFYEPQHIDLQFVPSLGEQRAYLAHLGERISTLMKQAGLAGQSKTWLQAEQEVRQQLESELLEATRLHPLK